MRLLDQVVSKGVKITVCGIKYIDLTTETVKILGVHFSCNQKLQKKKKIVKATLICKSIENEKHSTGGENNHLEKISII